MSYLPADAAERAQFPMFDGLFGYFASALAWVARCSKVGNDQHNLGEPLHWAMDKSTDHKNKIIKHLMDAGTDDTDGIPHSVKVAWRALAMAQEDLMARKGAPMPHNATGTPPAPKEHRRVATPAELRAYTDEAPVFPPYSEDNLPQPGHRVWVLTLSGGDTARGVKVGMTGTVLEAHSVPWVQLDALESRVPLIAETQLERIA